LLNIKVKQIF